MTKFSNAEKRNCAARELRRRLEVYPRWVLDGRLTKEQASAEIMTMAEIVDDYARLANHDEPTLPGLPL